MDEPALSVRGLSKSYGNRSVVGPLDFSLPPGSVTGLLGGNGAGKTTTIGMVMGLIEPTEGAIRVFGHDLLRERYAVLGRMNFESPYVDLPHRLTVRQNLRVFGMLYDVPDIEGKIEELADALALRDFLDRQTGRLSAGQKTRVAIAKALDQRSAASAARRADRLARSRYGGLGARASGGASRRRIIAPSCSPRTIWARSSVSATAC